MLQNRTSNKQFKKPRTFDRNIIVIGGGSAGLVTAYIAAAVKAKVSLIEQHKMGGECLNTGCVPSKALLRTARLLQDIKNAKLLGIESASANFEFADVMQRIQRIINTIAPHDSVERYGKLGVDCIQGRASVVSPYEVEVNSNVLRTKNIVIATGANPFIPPIEGIENTNYLTSENIWQLQRRPERMIILGGGPIGCELSQAFTRMGSKVTQVEMLPRLMSREDEDVSELIQKNLANEGVNILTSHKAKQIVTRENVNILICENLSTHEDISLEFDEILIAVGRKANTDNLGLYEVGVELNKNGTVLVNQYLQSSVPNIYACGDVAGPYQFTHTASHQAWYCAVNALFGTFKKFKADYSIIPWATFTDPEVARVGLNTAEAKEKNIPHEVTVFPLEELDRAITDSETQGFIKVLTKPGKDKILGATIVGAHAGELITEFITAMKHGIGLNKILGTIHIYPTFSEANKYAAGAWKRAHAPEKILKLLERFHGWRLGS